MATTRDDPVAVSTKHMVWVPGGAFLMGSNDFYPEEAPAHHVTVDGFWLDEHTVTVAEFRRVVKDTGYGGRPGPAGAGLPCLSTNARSRQPERLP
jgi:formylglycine-generating enzyme required for sulfatase activity